jgi:prevent-host-death family protein
MAVGNVPAGHERIRTATVSELRRELSDLVSHITYFDEGVVIERRGRPVAALISYQTYQILQSLLIREELV